MFRSTPNSLNSSIETTYSLGSTNSQTFLSLDIDDFCESYSRLKLLERDPAQDVISPTLSNYTMMRNTTIISSSPITSHQNSTQPELFETNRQQFFIDEPAQSSLNQQVSNNESSFSKFLAFLTKQDEEQNSIILQHGPIDSNNVSSSPPTMNRINNQNVEPSPRIHLSSSTSFNQKNYLSNNADSPSNESGNLPNVGESTNNPINTTSPSTPTSINSLLQTITSPSNSSNMNPKDSKTKLASSPKRKNSIVSTTNSNNTSSSSSSNIPTLINTKLTKQTKTTRKRKNSSTSPSQLSMQFNFPMWTFHFSKGRSNK
ncbi:predicted protein [Naegleria gruberi]|uniref:Predicted protein n=1 Tax=Naegleria gruberi TaxID=5762 RepID=D2V6D4_NAEGR|nr:uncharacterized protein NAEGRDRAFT_47035 [Naegleria gruberi]EFC47428.1 predicted protein [Naegleria gruberi]|eukprot:XP_002680172.1 predicted protein [Naegleria gruberi strain NEG-M]